MYIYTLDAEVAFCDTPDDVEVVVVLATDEDACHERTDIYINQFLPNQNLFFVFLFLFFFP